MWQAVIASKAKQSIMPRKEGMDCFVALLLAMTIAAAIHHFSGALTRTMPHS